MINVKKDQPFDFLLKIVFIVAFFIAANFLALSPLSIGLSLPANAAVWLCIAFVISVSCLKIIYQKKVVLSKLLIPIFVVFILIISIGLISTNSSARDVLLRLSQLMGIFLLFFSLTQYHFTQRKINFFFYLIVYSALVQIAYALLQMNHNLFNGPDVIKFYLGHLGIPVGGIRQTNALSIYLLTSLFISFYLLIQPSFKKQKKLKQISLFFLALGAGYIVALNASRAAYLAFILSLILMLVGSWKIIKKRKLTVSTFLCLILSGFLVGFLTGGDRIIDKKVGARMFAWNISSKLIIDRPLLGHGLGGFKKVFADKSEELSLNNSDLKQRNVVFFTHPHNELLYWGVEAGVIAIFSLLILVALFFKNLFKRRMSYILQYSALLVPVALQTQVSLPFYLSSILMFLFIFILVLAIRNSSKTMVLAIGEGASKLIIVVVLVSLILYAGFIKDTISGGKVFVLRTSTGENNFKLIEQELGSYYWGPLASVYSQVSSVRNSVKIGDKQQANKHVLWLEDFVDKNESPTYYQILLAAYNLNGDDKKSQKLISRLKNRYPSYFKHY